MKRILCIVSILLSALLPGGAATVKPGDHSLTLKVGDMDRRYIVHVPTNYDGRKPAPVVIMFHGGGGTAQGEMRETGWAQKADQESFPVVFPEATPPDPTKPSRFGANGQIWNDGSGRWHAGERNIPDAAFINTMIDDLIPPPPMKPRTDTLPALSPAIARPVMSAVGSSLSGKG